MFQSCVRSFPLLIEVNIEYVSKVARKTFSTIEEIAVGDHELEVVSESETILVQPGTQFMRHGAEVHRVLDMFEISKESGHQISPDLL